MILFSISIIITLISVLIANPSLVLSLASLSILSPSVSCFVICTDSIGILFSSGLLGLMLSLLASIVGAPPLYSLLILVLTSFVLSIIFAYAELKGNVEEVSEVASIFLILISIGLMLYDPQVALQGFYYIMKDVSLVTLDESKIYFIVSSILVLISLALKDNIVSVIFDIEYVSVIGSHTFARLVLTIFISVFGIGLTSYYLGLFASQSLLVLPTLLALRSLRKDLHEVVDLAYVISMLFSIISIKVSSEYSIPIVGATVALLVIAIVLLDLWNSIVRQFYKLKGRRYGHSVLNSSKTRQQENQKRSV